MKTYASEEQMQVGDLSNEFALTTFFPERLQKPISIASELCFAFFNMCGFVNFTRNWLAKKAAPASVKNTH